MKKQNRFFLLSLLLFSINVQICQAARVTSDQIVLYTFKEGKAKKINDVSDVGLALNLTIANAAAIRWIPGGGLSVDASTIIESGVASTKVIDAVKTSNEITIEAWIKPANTTQGGPAEIITISVDSSSRNFTLAQQANTYNVRLRTTITSLNGMPSVATPAGTLTTNLTHVVYTRDASGAVQIYIDGNEEANGNIGGDCSNWDDSYNLALANELTNDHTWLGEIYLVAIYDRALTKPEVDQNFAEGAIVECNVDGDCDDSNICTDDACVDYECQYTNNNDPCDDGLFCTQTDECQNGQCVGSDDPCLDDGDFCNGGEHCQEDVGSFLCNSTGDPCDLLLTCDGVSDVCDVSDVSLIIADAFGYSGIIDIELENSFDSVGEVHVDVCDIDQRSWLHIDTGSCGTTARSSGFSCVISDLGGGCVRVDLTTVSGVIDPGSGPIAQLSYTIDAITVPGDFADVTPENSDVRDESAVALSVTPKPGMIGVLDCVDNGDCDDNNVCTDDACVGNVCQYTNNAAACDDGFFCTGADACSGGSCSVHSGNSCSPGTTCNESTDSCDSNPVTSTTTSTNPSPITTTTTISECESDADCDGDELFCNGNEICLQGECRHEGSPCSDDGLFCNGEESCDEENGECVSSGDPCPDDGLFCNGEESCDEENGECVNSGNPCPDSTSCFEETEECRSRGMCAICIESEAATLVSGQSLNFTIKKTGDCGDPDYEWSIQSEIGSTIDQNGNYTAGVNKKIFKKLSDVVRVVDYANGDITSEITVTVSWQCFLVKIYGEDSEEIKLMRSFRDSALSQTAEGRELIRLYYEFSPVIMMALESDEDLRQEVKALVDQILPLIKSETR